MSDTLIDPAKPAHALVETRKDGSALRNDGVELKSANANPWYVLATIYGEQDGDEIDWELHARNRRFWNGWNCAGMDEAERQTLAERLDLPIEELAPLSPWEAPDVKKAFADRLPKGTQFPDLGGTIVFGETHISKALVLTKYVFDGPVDFRFATLSCTADFRFATFSRSAYFVSATFNWPAYFQSATFSDFADFQYATFSGSAVFQSVTFSGFADFVSATFSRPAVFQSATFSGSAVFHSATFSGPADFSDGAFAAETSFKETRFETVVPKFFQRDLHQNTTFTPKDANWPTITADNAEAGKQAYTRLRQLMNGLEKPDDAHFFFRQEMRCKAFTEKGLSAWLIRFYGLISDYGYSVGRPLGALGFLFLLGLGANWGYFTSGGTVPADVADGPFWSAFGLFFGSLFGFLGINRIYFVDLLKTLPDVLKALAGFQTVFGFILLFFLGLGLRNHFRLK